MTAVSGSSLQTSGGQTEGMARQNAITGLSDQLCGSGESCSPQLSPSSQPSTPQHILAGSIRHALGLYSTLPAFRLPSFPSYSISSRGCSNTPTTRTDTTAVMLAQPHTSSGIHHHASQDTIVYAIRGTGAIVSMVDGKKVKKELKAGDWALIPAGVEHQEMNEGDEEVGWVIVRGGREAEVVNVEGWEGE